MRKQKNIVAKTNIDKATVQYSEKITIGIAKPKQKTMFGY